MSFSFSRSIFASDCYCGSEGQPSGRTERIEYRHVNGSWPETHCELSSVLSAFPTTLELEAKASARDSDGDRLRRSDVQSVNLLKWGRICGVVRDPLALSGSCLVGAAGLQGPSLRRVPVARLHGLCVSVTPYQGTPPVIVSLAFDLSAGEIVDSSVSRTRRHQDSPSGRNSLGRRGR